jgi:hypothetical protein
VRVSRSVKGSSNSNSSSNSIVVEVLVIIIIIIVVVAVIAVVVVELLRVESTFVLNLEFGSWKPFNSSSGVVASQ